MRYRVMMIDDHSLIVDALMLTVCWEKLQCEVVATANDAIEGMTLALEKKPDIIISDIKMPEMDGLEMIRHLRQKGCEALVVFLSGYNEFHFAQEALRLGAFDYLLKPCDNREIERVIQNCINELVQKNTFQVDSLEWRLRRSQYLSDLAYGVFDTEKDLDEDNPSLGIDLSCYSVLMVAPSDSNCMLKKYISKITKAWNKETIQTTIETTYENCLVFVCLHNRKDTAFSLNHQILSLYEQIKRSFIGISVSYHAGVCRRLTDSSQFPIACAQAMQELSVRPLDQKNLCFIDIQDANTQNQDFYTVKPKQLDALAQSLVLCIATGKDTGHIMGEIRTHLHQNSGSSLIYLKNEASQLCGLILRHCVGKINLEGCDLSAVHMISTACHIDEIDTCLKKLAHIMEIASQQRLENYSHIVSNALQFINEHATECISLSMVAEQQQVTAAYLSGQIKRETGKNFVDIVTGIRMEKAKQMIKTSFLSIDEISQSCGFKDYPYFYQVFKKYVGISPKAYRNGKDNEV